jgi:hypothetical protein
MRRKVLVTAALLAAVFPMGVGSISAGRSPLCKRGQTSVERDPRGLLLISGIDPIGAATAAALRHERRSYRPQVRGALLATMDRERGTSAKYSCGTRVWQRTIVVYIVERAMLPAQSASQRVYFVGRFRSGYHVWQVVH